MNLGLVLLVVLSSRPAIGQTCSSAYNRLPENSDLAVVCGPNYIQLSINVCPVYFANFFPQELALNGKHNQTACLGAMDNSTDVPVLKFTMFLDDFSVCGNFIEILNAAGIGDYSAYSTVQTVAISGFVDSLPISDTGMVSYSTNLYYNFSCHYPLQYFLNNTELFTSFGAVAINSNNGSFLSTLRMQIFKDESFSTETTSNGTIYALMQTIYVQVSMNNSATSFNVYLDHCFATPTPLLSTTINDSYSFFTGCNVENKTTIISNGKDKAAKFSFKSFRFLQHSAQKTSSIYLHCKTRLCELQNCPTCPNSRKRRAADASGSIADPVIISSGPFYVSDATSEVTEVSSLSGGGSSEMTDSQTGIIVGLIFACIIGVSLLILSWILYKMYYRQRSTKSSPYPTQG